MAFPLQISVSFWAAKLAFYSAFDSGGVEFLLAVLSVCEYDKEQLWPAEDQLFSPFDPTDVDCARLLHCPWFSQTPFYF